MDDVADPAVVTVSFNTLELTALLLWSLPTILDADVDILEPAIRAVIGPSSR